MQPENYQPNPNPVPPPTPVQPPQQPEQTQQPQQFTNPTPPQQPAAVLDYVSNPFLVGFRTLIETLKTNPVPVLLTPLVFVLGIILMAIISGILGATGSAGAILSIIFVIVFYLAVVPAMIGMYYSIAAHSNRGEAITTKEAFSHGLKKALPMLGLIIISSLLTVLGLILLIVPGVRFLVRAALAPVLLYEEDLGVFAAIGRSFALTKGHFFETLGAVFAGGLLGGNGLLPIYFGTTQMVGRYHDYKAVLEAGAAKPKVHWLNYFIVLIIPVLIAAYVGVIALAFKDAQNKANETQIKSQQNLRDSLENSRYNSGGSSLDYKYDYNYDY
jgi:flagellar basal body-associated protein FliL